MSLEQRDQIWRKFVTLANSKSVRPYFQVCLEFGKISNLLWKTVDGIGQNFIVTIGQIFNKLIYPSVHTDPDVSRVWDINKD